MSDNNNWKNNVQDRINDLSTVEMLVADASVAIDDGNLKGALGGFQQALDLTQSIYGETPELDNLRAQIAEIKQMMAGSDRLND